MSLLFKVGSQAHRTSAGSLAVTGVGFQPVLVLLYGTVGSNSNQEAQFCGAVDAASNEWSITWAADNGANTMNTARSGSESQCVLQISGGAGTVLFAANLTSMDSDGFTLNYTTGSAGGWTFRYVAIGGSGVSAQCGFYTAGAATGTQAVTGVGFRPEALIVANNFANVLTANPSAYMGYGVASGPSNQGAFGLGSNDGVGVAAINVVQRTDHISVGNLGGASQWEIQLDSFDSDGFTLDVTNDNGGTGIRHAYAAIAGGQFHVGSFDTRTTNGTTALTGAGFRPLGVLFTGYMQPGAIGPVSNRSFHASFGAYDGTSEWATSGLDQAGAGVSVTRSYESATKCLGTLADAATTVIVEADGQSLDADGMTLSYTTSDATARQNLWMAFGADPFLPRIVMS